MASEAAAPPPWQAGLSPELVAAASATIAVVEHCAVTLPSPFYTPPAPVSHTDRYTWVSICEEHGVKVYGKRSDHGPPHAVGVAHFAGHSAEEVADYLFAPQHMSDWDSELCEHARVLKMLNDDAALAYLDYYGEEALGFSIVSPRNLVVLTVRQRQPDGTVIIASQSVADALGPSPPRGSVRARLVSGGGVVTPRSAEHGGGCTVMFETQVDFGGALPPAIVAMVARTSPLALATARRIIAGEVVPASKQTAAHA